MHDPLPAELDPRCYIEHCYIHHVDEPHAGAYTFCGECLHSFPTRGHLMLDHTRTMLPIYLKEFRQARQVMHWGPPRWRIALWMIRTPLRRPALIRVCPHCAHDL